MEGDRPVIVELDVSDHADLRMRKRLGIPRKAVERQAQAALAHGARHRDYAGSFRRYLDRVYLSERAAPDMRVHGGFLYLFNKGVLITCWPVPPKYRSIKPRGRS